MELEGLVIDIKRLFFILLVLCFCFSGCKDTQQKEIDEIYIYHSSFGQRYPEYKIDLKSSKFWEFTGNDGMNFVERDESSEKEGYTFVSGLSKENIDAFLHESARYGLTKWESSYYNDNILDGHQQGMVIYFTDSTEYAVYGSNKYPKTWDKMRKAFRDLTGKDVLMFASNWIDDQVIFLFRS